MGSRSLFMSPDNPSESGIREGEPPIVPRPIPAEEPRSPAPLIILLFVGGAVWLGSAITLVLSSWAVFVFCGVPMWLVSLIPAGAFLAWQPGVWQLKNTESSIPMPIRTWALLLVVSLLSLLNFVAGWEYGLQYQGIDHTRKCALISAGLALTSSTLLGIAARTKDFHLNVLGHAALFYWIASYAFPYLGELP